MLRRSSDQLLPAEAVPAGPAPTLDSPAGAVDLSEMVRIIRRRWWVVALTAGSLIGIAVAFLLAVTPLYTAASTILIDPRRENVMENQAVLSSFGIDDAAIESQVLLIQSSTVLARVIDTLKLAEDPEFGLDAATLARLKQATDKPFDETARTILIDSLQRRLKVTRQGTTFLVDVNLNAKDPVRAATIANAIADTYLLEQIRTKFDVTKVAAGWLDKQLQELKSRVIASEKAVEDYRAANNLMVSQGVALNDQQITDLNNKLIEARVQTAEARAKYQQVQEIAKGGGDPGSIAEALSSDVIARLRTQYAEIAKNEADLLAKYGARHPSVTNVRAQLRDTQRLINEEVKRILDSTRHAFEVATSREASLQKSLDDLKGISSESSQALVRLRELQREADANRSLYESYLARFKETTAQETMQRADSRIIARAAVPLRPSFPKKALTLGVSILVGLGLGCVLAFLVDYLDRRVKTTRQVEAMSNLPVLTAMPLIGPRELARRAKRGKAELARLPADHKGLLPPVLQPPMLRYALEEPTSIFAESVRAIRLAVQRTARMSAVRTIMVASSVPNEGKSTIASNLALSLATIGVRTVLVDGDLRNPQLTRGLCPRAEIGLFDVAAGYASLEQALLIDPTGLAVLPSPRRRDMATVAEFMSADGMIEVIERLQSRFSLIIVDAPPLVPLVDARAFAEQADAIIFAAAWNRTPDAVIRQALDLLVPVYDRILGTVLTQVDLVRLQHYDYYRSSAQLKSYSYYYQPQREAAQ